MLACFYAQAVSTLLHLQQFLTAGVLATILSRAGMVGEVMWLEVGGEGQGGEEGLEGDKLMSPQGLDILGCLTSI